MRQKYLDLLNTLPEPYRTKSIHNFNYQNAYMHMEHPFIELNNVARALKMGFFWDNTGEGWSYWKKLHENLVKGNINLITFYNKYLVS